MPLWTPAFLGFAALVSWLKADAITGLSDGQAVSSWLDSSGHGKDAVNATGGEQPLYKTAIQNGLPAVRFDGVDDDLIITSPGLPKPSTVVFVARLTNASPVSASRLFSMGSAMTARIGGTAYQIIGPTALNYHTGLDTNTHLHVLTWDGANSRCCFDGTVVTGDSGATASAGNAAIASAGTANWIAVDMLEVALVSGSVVSSNLDRLDGYLAWKYGLQANLPGGHPYKSAAPLIAVTLTAGIV